MFLVYKYMAGLFFFFQAEDGIRDRDVTGVQTCALPISGIEAFLDTWIPNWPELQLDDQTHASMPPFQDLVEHWDRLTSKRGSEPRTGVQTPNLSGGQL